MTTVNTQTFSYPEKYAKLGVHTKFEPTPPERLRMIVQGKTGDGKSTFIGGIPGSLILDFDDAAQNILDRRAAAVPVRSWEDYLAIAQMVLDDKKAGTCPFTRVQFDSVDTFIELLDKNMIASKQKQYANVPNSSWHNISSVTEWGAEGAGYRILRNEVMKEFNRFFLAGIPWTAVCQMKPHPSNTKEHPLRVLMSPSMFGLLSITADMCVRIYTKSVTEDVKVSKNIGGRDVSINAGQRTLTKFFLDVASDDPLSDEKCRILGLDTTICLPPTDSWAAFCDMYNKSIAKLKSGEYLKTAVGASSTAALKPAEPAVATESASK